ncbi:MAG: hypothetical protein GY950_22980, partial [bacterium]|nr:hypothetical protein [bacterium]
LTLCNIKFTGLVYGAAIVGLSWLAVFIIDRDYQKRFVKYMGAAFLLAVVVIGYQPYITNLVHKGNPFYPSVTFAKGGNNVVSRQAPADFIKKNRFSKLFYSLFSKSENRLGHMPRLKMPLSIDDSEMTAFNNVDARYGGFGPLFGTVLLIMISAIPLLFKAKRLIILYTLIAAAIILISTLLNPEAWWARLAPQLWLLPVTFLVSFYYIPRDHRMVYVRGFVISLMFLNSL